MRWGSITGTKGALCAACLWGLACGAKTVRLGNESPVPFTFGTPTVLVGFADTDGRSNPTLTADLLEIYFVSSENANGNGDVWVARRNSRAEPFAAAAPVAGVNSTDRETSSAISADGLELWVGSQRPRGLGGMDIWHARRPSRNADWSAPTNLAVLNTPDDDIPRSPGQHGLVMPLANTKQTVDNQPSRTYQTYFASRATKVEPFGAPSRIPGFAYAGVSVVDGCLTDDGLALFFSSIEPAFASLDGGSASNGGATDSNIFISLRQSVGEPFMVPQLVSELNTPNDERDPWLSPDGSMFFFVSDRDGVSTIYSAPVLPPR